MGRGRGRGLIRRRVLSGRSRAARLPIGSSGIGRGRSRFERRKRSDERGYENVRAFASARSAGSTVPFGDGSIAVEEATPEALGAGDVDLFFFSVGTSASRELVPIACATA